MIHLTIASGYSVRTYRTGDEQSFLRLMADGEFDPWDEERLEFNIGKIIPGGWFFGVHVASNAVVGTAMCLHNYSGKTPFWGDVGWLACDPRHRGKGLGHSLTGHVTNRFLRAGYSQIQLHTEYWRLPAIKIYLRLGYIPVISSTDTYALWDEVCRQLAWEFRPAEWTKRRESQAAP